jgi:hypothetical protein
MWTSLRRGTVADTGAGSLLERYEGWIKEEKITRPNDWIFFQEEDHSKPMWDSGVRKALKIFAQDVECDFPGFGLHSSGAPKSPCARKKVEVPSRLARSPGTRLLT